MARALSAARRKAMNRRKRKLASSRKGGAKRRRLNSKTKSSALAVKRTRFVRMGRTLPTHASVVLRYHVTKTVTSTIDSVIELVKIFPGSIFLPETGGHQPFGRDTWAGIYNRYSVSKCVIKGTISIRGVGNDEDRDIFLLSDVNANQNAPTKRSLALSHKNYESGRYRVLKMTTTAAPPRFGVRAQARSFSITIIPKRLVKNRFNNADNASGWSDMDSSPQYDDTLLGVATPEFTIWSTDGDRSVTTSPPIVINLMVTYHVNMTDVLTLGQS